MTGRYKFADLKQQLAPERVQKAALKTKSMMADMLIPEIRMHSGMTQREVVDILGISQPALSKIEHEEDIQIGTLSKMIEATGGTLEIIAHLPQGDCRLNRERPLNRILTTEAAIWISSGS